MIGFQKEPRVEETGLLRGTRLFTEIQSHLCSYQYSREGGGSCQANG